MTNRLALRLARLTAFTLLVTVVSIALMRTLHVPFSWQEPGEYIAMFTIHAFVIGAICWTVMPPLGEWTEHFRWELRWTILVGALLAMAIAGTAIASIAIHFSLPDAGSVPFPAFFGKALETAIPLTLAVGVITTLIVASRDRLELSHAALQEQRLQRERAEKLAAETQAASLASRVQPHFLFNALNSVAALIRENPDEAEQTLQRLASLVRTSLDTTGTVPLETEVKLVREYLEIQKTRLRDRLKFTISVEPFLNPAVPPFSIQTLVENSVKHVAEVREQGVDVRIQISRSNSEVLISVTDNGMGFDSKFAKPGHGLDILQQRLRTMYGDRTSLEFSGEPGRVTVGFRVPVT